MNYALTSAAVTESNPFPNSRATTVGNANYCGANTYTFAPTKTFLSVSGSSISVETSNFADIGVYTVAVTVLNYSGVPSITKNLTITISCFVFGIAFITAPAASTTLQIGIDVQPMVIPFLINQTPACG